MHKALVRLLLAPGVASREGFPECETRILPNPFPAARFHPGFTSTLQGGGGTACLSNHKRAGVERGQTQGAGFALGESPGGETASMGCVSGLLSAFSRECVHFFCSCLSAGAATVLRGW